jgi:hypothetical protein
VSEPYWREGDKESEITSLFLVKLGDTVSILQEEKKGGRSFGLCSLQL